MNQCESSDARKLCIFDIGDKLKESDKYDIGGTYTNGEPDLSFYFTTSVFNSGSYILNLFVCHRNIDSFRIKISDTHSIRNKMKEKGQNPNSCLVYPGPLKSKLYTSSEIDESHYIRSFKFSKTDVNNVHTLYIPIEIEFNVKPTIDEEVLTWIKENHNFKIFKLMENTDFTIISSSGKKYDTHKLLLAMHSPVLRDKIRNSQTNLMSLNIDDDEMSLLLEFLYTDTICDIDNKDWDQILKLIEMFHIDGLIKLIQVPMREKICVDNAIHIAILSEKYKLYDIQRNVIDFIMKHPEVLETESWNNLNDVVLTKKLLKGICKNTK